MSSLTLLRHAPLPSVYHRRYNGWSDLPIDPTLVDSQQLNRLRRTLTVDRIYSSDLVRCQQTVELLFGKDCSFVATPALREVRFREEIEGKLFAEVEKLPSFNRAYLESQSRWHAYLCDESEEDFYRRLDHLLSGVPRGEDLLFCTHAGTIGGILKCLGQPARSLGYLESITLSI